MIYTSAVAPAHPLYLRLIDNDRRESTHSMRGWLANSILRLLALFPLRVVHAIGSLLGALLWHSGSELRRVTEINLRSCMPELSESDRKNLARATVRETGKAMAETGPLWRWSTTRALAQVRHVTGEDAMRAAVAAGQGVVVASPHLGAWEIIGLYLSAYYPITILYRPPRFSDLEQLMIDARSRGGAKLATTTPGGVRLLYQALSRHECVGILPDQDPGEGGGLFAPFFGIPAYTMTLIPRLVRKTGAAVFLCYARRLSDGAGFDIHFVPVDLRTSDESDESATEIMNRAIEDAIREMPDQYQWGYRRFKTRPSGEKKLY